MKTFSPFVVFLLFFILVLSFGGTCHAKKRHLFKVASLAPEGSVWSKRFKGFAKEIEKKTNGEVKFKIYPGGVMGDDRAMYRKMQVGQLHGGGFTMTGISEVVNDFRVLGIPFLLRDYSEVDHLKNELMPHFKKKFTEKGLALIAMSEVGFIHTMSKESISTVSDLMKSKSWAPAGDPLGNAYLETIGVTPTPLSIPDVLPSLQTGLINTVFNSYYGSIVLQWFTKINYVTDIPFGYAYGALVLDEKRFSKLSAEQVELMESTAQKHFAELLGDTRKSNKEALQVLKDNGIKIVNTSPDTLNELQNYREETIQKLVGKAFSPEVYKIVEHSLQEMRGVK